MGKIKEKIIRFIKCILIQEKDWHNLVLLLIIAAAFFNMSVNCRVWIILY